MRVLQRGAPMLRLRSLQALGYGGGSASSSSSAVAQFFLGPKLQASDHGSFLHLFLLSSFSSSSAQPELQEAPAPPPCSPSPDLETLISYHERTKHSLQRYADAPHGLDWACQPNPFRTYKGATLISLRHLPPLNGNPVDQLYSRVFSEFVNPSMLSKASVSQLLYDSFSLSAWRKGGPVTWSLRVNPSNGNLHPTEAYVISGPLAGVTDMPFIAHYAPKDHEMEIRTEISFELWRDLTKGFPPGTVFIGLTSIFWRQAWKYGERAFRYCHHDAGHAIGSIAMAGCALGWESVLLDGWGNEELDHLLGVAGRKQMPTDASKQGHYPELEQEHAICLVALFPGRAHQDTTIRGKHDYSVRSRPRDDSVFRMTNVMVPSETLAGTIRTRMAEIQWKGKPNSLSKDHVWWDIIDKAATASIKPTTPTLVSTKPLPQWVSFTHTYVPLSLRQVINKRRSAVGMDGKFVLQREAFYQILWKASPSGFNSERQGDQQQFPFRVLPWKAELHLAIFVHKVSGLPKGLYFLVRNSEHEQQLRQAMRPEFQWEKPEKCPQHLPLYKLAEADCEKIATHLSCYQDIAGDSCFSLGMIAHFDAVNERGASMYPRLFWESGVLGQLLYLEAHAVGISASGIGCYFDDEVHKMLGFKGKEFQCVYHFTVGSSVEDRRILKLPGYPGPDE